MPRDDSGDQTDALAGYAANRQDGRGLTFRDVPAGQRAMQSLEAYWRDIKGANHLPRRRDLDASQIEEALPHAFILEQIAPGIARIRTGGQVVCGHMGFEARGMPLSVLFAPDSRNGLRRWLERCFEDPALVDLPVTARRGILQAPITGRLLLLPLLDQEDRVTRAVGGLFLDQPARLAKVKFDIREDSTLRCQRLVQPSQPVLHAVAGDRVGTAPSTHRRPQLRLVVSNP